MNWPDIIRIKRDGGALSASRIAAIVDGLADGSLSDAQAGAFAMAVFARGMDFDEAAALTLAMAASGAVIDWAGALPGPALDKHSTGGVGDKVSLVLAPIVAACGGFVPMISGRGLGHTGGTLDKLAAIPGYDVGPDLARFKEVVRSAGCAIVGQTGELAPADKRLYAIRDMTATIESTPLITASILSKKLAAGVGGLVMDIKAGSGAFMATVEEARALGSSMSGTAAALGLPMRVVVSDMDQVLGTAAGNVVEVREAIDYLTGAAREPRLDALVMTLAAEMLALGRIDADPRAALDSGAAAERFGRMVAALGGPADLIERSERHLPRAPVSLPVTPDRAGYLAKVDVRAIGEAVIGLGGGRRRIDDAIDPSVGFTDIVPLGAEVGPGRSLAIVHGATQAAAEQGLADFARACIVAGERPGAAAVIHAIG